ncbi:thioredoxin-dependent thiol peroxidase [Calditrichota bacterium]
MIQVGKAAPDFNVMNQDNISISLNELRGQWVILYFYPKDNTSGCTIEAKDFTALQSEFEDLDAKIFGVSPDTVKSHCNFIEKQALGIDLLSDPDHTILEAYGAWGTKKMYGKEYQGVVRSTYIIDPEGKIAAAWTKVKAKGHADEVKAKLYELQS